MRRTVLGLLLVAAGAIGAVAGAESKLEPPELDRYLRWGPLRVRPGARLSNLGYDDNILYRADRKVGDYTATISPRLDGLVLLGRRAFVTFDGRLDHTLYLHTSDQNYTNWALDGRATLPLRDLGVFVEWALSDSKERPIDREDIRASRTERSGAAGVVWRPGWRTEIELAGTATDLRYSDPDFTSNQQTIGERLDRVERGTRADVSYRIRGRSSLLLRTEWDKIAFDSPFLVDGEPVDRDTTGFRVLTGIELGRGGPLTGRLLVGRATIDARSPRIPDLADFVCEADAVYRIGALTRIEVTAKRAPGFSVRGDTSYYVSTQGGLRWVRFLNRLIGVEAGGEFGRLAFPESITFGDRRDDIRRFDVGMRLRLFGTAPGRRVEYRLRVGRYRRDSTEPYARQDKNTVTVDATIGF